MSFGRLCYIKFDFQSTCNITKPRTLTLAVLKPSDIIYVNFVTRVRPFPTDSTSRVRPISVEINLVLILLLPPMALHTHCGLWPVEQCPSIFYCLPPTLSIFSLPALEDLFLRPLSILSWVFPFSTSLPALE